mgnify:CR=1 FL=1
MYDDLKSQFEELSEKWALFVGEYKGDAEDIERLWALLRTRRGDLSFLLQGDPEDQSEMRSALALADEKIDDLEKLVESLSGECGECVVNNRCLGRL